MFNHMQQKVDHIKTAERDKFVSPKREAEKGNKGTWTKCGIFDNVTNDFWMKGEQGQLMKTK